MLTKMKFDTVQKGVVEGYIVWWFSDGARVTETLAVVLQMRFTMDGFGVIVSW